MRINKDGDLDGLNSNRSHWEILNNGQIVVSNSPESLWLNAMKYFQWCDENPIYAKATITSGKEAGKKVEQELIRPYSVRGLCIHCGISEEYLSDIKRNKNPDSLYYQTLLRIEYVIHTQNLEHAMVGVFNPIFTSKVLAMDQKGDDAPAQVTVNIVGDLPQLSMNEDEARKLEVKK